MGRDTKSYEGFRDKIYKDTEGFSTIGYGHKLTKEDIASGKYAKGISEEQATSLYNTDRASHDERFFERNPQYRNASTNVKSALGDMAYNMGPDFLDKFPKAAEHLANGNYDGASKEFMNSKYADQVGQRAIDNAALIAQGTSQPELPEFNFTPNPTVLPEHLQREQRLAHRARGLGDIKQPTSEAPDHIKGLGRFTSVLGM